MNIRTIRKLENIHQALTPLAKQGNGMGFITNNENAQRIDGLVKDIHEAIMDYQVCMINCSPMLNLTVVLDFITARYL